MGIAAIRTRGRGCRVEANNVAKGNDTGDDTGDDTGYDTGYGDN
jgi:hypothetical protein